jgi:hypothetical protein
MTIVRSTRTHSALFAFAMLAMPVSAIAASTPAGTALPAAPSRAAEKGCKWEKFSDAKLGLDTWVQRCDFGKRKIDFIAGDHSLNQRYSDSSGAPELVVAVLDIDPAETPEHGIQRIFAARTEKNRAAQCVLAPFHDSGGLVGAEPEGVKRYTFVANHALAKALKAKADPNDVPEPACGAWGDDPDGIQYFETQSASAALHKVLFVRVGQDEPLFDEATLRIR